MKYKYGFENVAAKRDFEVFKHDDNGELIGVVTVPKNCKGLVESMGRSSSDEFRNCYDVLFSEGDKEISVVIYEEDFEVLLDIQR